MQGTGQGIIPPLIDPIFPDSSRVNPRRTPWSQEFRAIELPGCFSCLPLFLFP